jgi:2-amino-4-hydroxy-6-hydroxymethyldihydropteridine diphosphokinase
MYRKNSVCAKENKHALIAFGANLPFLGDTPEQTVRKAVDLLSEEFEQDLSVSRLFVTPCYPAGAGPDYVNAAAAIVLTDEDDLASILVRLHAVEARFGRERQQRWGMRTLDIDLLAVGESVLPDPATQDQWRNLSPEAQIKSAPDQLILPHPRLQDRAFVLVPLADIAPVWVHPRTGLTVTEMLAALPPSDVDAVKPL